MCDLILSMLYSIHLLSSESKLLTLCSLKSGGSSGRGLEGWGGGGGLRTPLATLFSYPFTVSV